MTKFVKENWFKLSTIILIIILSVAYYYFIFLPNSNIEFNKENQLIIIQKELEETKNQLNDTQVGLEEAKKALDEEISKEAEVVEKIIEKPVYEEAEPNYDLILLNYKMDVKNGEESENSLLTALYNNTHLVCSYIVSNSDDRGHLYYYVLDATNSLKKQYGQYRSKIEYIDNNLNSRDVIIQYIKNECALVGFNI